MQQVRTPRWEPPRDKNPILVTVMMDLAMVVSYVLGSPWVMTKSVLEKGMKPGLSHSDDDEEMMVQDSIDHEQTA